MIMFWLHFLHKLIGKLDPAHIQIQNNAMKMNKCLRLKP